MAVDIKAALEKRAGQVENTVLKDMAEMFDLSVRETDILELPVEQLQTYAKHPFRVSDDAALEELKLDIQNHGVLQPIIVRPKGKSGMYEILAGHRRTAAVRESGQERIKAIIVQADDELASRIVLNTNFKVRGKFYPSEIARSYKLRHDELRKQKQENSTGWNSDALIYRQLEQEFSISKSKLYMYLRFNYLIEDLMDMLDIRKLSTKAAVELSYLKMPEQILVYREIYLEKVCAMDKELAVLLRQKSSEAELTEENFREVCEQREGAQKKEEEQVWYPEFKKYQDKFKSHYEMQQAILRFLETY